MGADYVIHQSCKVKQLLGDGDNKAGTAEMVRLLKIGTMVRVFEEQAQKESKSPNELSVTRLETNVTTGKVVERQLNYADLQQEELRLTALSTYCQGCPVCLFDEQFGCYSSLRYPISAQSERWLMGRLQPADTPGGFLCLRAIDDLGYDGEVIRSWREAKTEYVNIFELKTAVEQVLDQENPADTTVNSNQIWHSLLALGESLEPFHCLYVPIWLGAVHIDGKVPHTAEDLQTISRLDSPDVRAARTTFDVGSTDQGPDIFGVQRLLYACYNAWLRGVPLLMDA